jgi:hypothetical protein
MTEEPRNNTKTHLALAIAQGVSVAAWARASGVNRRTAFRRAKDPSVRKIVEDCRRRMIDQALGRMTRQTNMAANIIIKIAKEADSHTVQLRAARGLLSDVMAVSRFGVLESRMTEIETALDQQAAAKNSPPMSWSPTSYGKYTAPDPKVSATPSG